MWADKPVTRETLEAYIEDARDNGEVKVSAPFADNVMNAIFDLADAFPNPTPELIEAVYTAFENPTSDIL